MRTQGRWRVIGLTENDAAMNMAIDEAIADAVSAGISGPTIRFYRWKPRAISIGYFQIVHKEVDVRRCRDAGVDIVRRKTGGGAVYHDEEITYSLIAPETCVPDDIGECYRGICGHITEALREIGITSSFRPVNDVVVGGRKISGSAQTRRKKVVTQHGTVLYGLDRNAMFSILRPSVAKLADKGIKSFADGVTCVSEECDASLAELYMALVRAFTMNKDWHYGKLSDEENMMALTAFSKYISPVWTFSR